MSELVPPTLDDVRRAASNIAGHMGLPTPLVYSPGLSERLDAHVSLKLETANPISVFKLRGGIHLVSELPEAERRVEGEGSGEDADSGKHASA